MIKKDSNLTNLLAGEQFERHLADKNKKKAEQSTALKICRQFAKDIKHLGFKKLTNKMLFREKEHIIEFISIHKYSFGPCFRLHSCIRVKNDPRESESLTGIISDGAGYDGCPPVYYHDIEFDETDGSLEKCVNRMVQYVKEVAVPWYARWDEPMNLITDDDSPLGEGEKGYLRDAIKGKGNLESVTHSLSLFKIK